ncbi:DUF2158 domain-containing protein [Lujinxingia vulgaris]|uniref:DUF2158 domain-containing protein n=1 Tax=Lujinxingia vulgaris TaxID=2600176 RepID=A0A5C6XKR9_9DELT|nr:DUF2158 domain-containing protein [Lujinxingia vulgaris]
MKEARFKAGDIVVLKSGGPKMTIQEDSNRPPHRYECKWFSGSKVQRDWFAEESLAYPGDEKPK